MLLFGTTPIRRLLIVTAVAASLFVAVAATSIGQQKSPGADFFELKVRPLLSEKCYSCHSAASKPIMGGLRLDTREATLAGGSHGPAIVPGHPEKSLLMSALQFTDTLKMPPAGKLSDPEIAVFAEWIKMGAPDPRTGGGSVKKPMGMSLDEGRKYWAFQPLSRAAPPPLATAKGSLSLSAWCKTPIDRFIGAKLIEKGITLNRSADGRTLIRRAYLDLIGLPPSPTEVNSFLNDTAPDAWSKVIDHLLASPHYGERWGRHWLDLARFAESHGYEQDYDRPYAYHYRDFVIKALNEDMPYDQFCKWQLAGDEYEPDNPMALMATGFLAAGTHATQITKNQVEKERYDELDDMLSTTCTSMLALTAGCARCHDHKYDPIPTRDYYRMLSTFTTTVRSDYDVNMDPEGYRKARQAFDREHQPFVEAREKFEIEQLPGRFDAWLAGLGSTPLEPAWIILDSVKAQSSGGATFTQQADGSVLASGANPDNDTYIVTASLPQGNIASVRLDALADSTLVKGGPGRAPNGNFALSDFKLTVTPVGDKPVEAALVNPRVDFEQKGQSIRDSVGKEKGLGWAIDPLFGKDHAAAFDLAIPVHAAGAVALKFTMKFDHPNPGHSIGRFRLSFAQTSLPLDAPSRPERVETILAAHARAGGALGDADRTTALNWYKTTDADWQRLNREEREHAGKAPKPPIEKALISSEGVPAVRTHTQGGDFLEHTWFLTRGDPNKKGEVATQSFLEVLVHSPDGEKHWQRVPPKGWRTSYQRRALAEWMTDVDAGAGALLARVMVNRLWQHHFGRGIVATPSDFGVQGEKPSHPELLDWLAQELIRSGWRLKPIHKLMMTSAVYMESSAANQPPSKLSTASIHSTQTPVAEAAKLDAGNKLFWRHNRQRLEAEAIRDSMLAVSGELDQKMYGPGTLDESMKRRSIYFFVKRSKLIPTLMLFDAPNALLGLGNRATTTVAPQALMLMNNAFVREYARNFAKRAMGQDTQAGASAVVRAYELALSRPPTAKELQDGLAFISAQAASYNSDGKKDAVQDAFADLCQVLFGLNEFVYVN